eukprot:TRINITY_DN2168_c0_g1_i2.p1 TRINITY_DN2168_c0_g1~~TRINITY_DN2168_c0_g1_i2.p1  ORF type:complete len:113 (+),score=10.73 TRINITY_DN2168_c0_g1_i2:82-420(+)
MATYNLEEVEEDINDQLRGRREGLVRATPEEVLARLNNKNPIGIRRWKSERPSEVWTLMKGMGVTVDDEEALKNLLIANGYLRKQVLWIILNVNRRNEMGFTRREINSVALL